VKLLLGLRTWLTRGVLLYALWLLFVGYVDDPVELICGIAALGLALLGLDAARRQQEPMHVPLRTATGALRVPWELVRDSLVVLASIPVRRRGRFRSAQLATADDPSGRGRRAYAEARGTIAPNAIVLDVDPEQNLALLHELDPRVPGSTS
jgi:hypothetical protein